MCRLYVFRSTEKTKLECTLVPAQNALITQSRCDSAGLGLETYSKSRPYPELALASGLRICSTFT